MSDQKKRIHIEKDPHKEREAQKYDRPIPSREYLFEIIDKQDKLLLLDEITALVGMVSEEDQEALRRRLQAMVRDGQLHKNRTGAYGPISKFDLVRGRVDSHPDGFGFLHPEDGRDKMFIPFRQMHSLMNGDRILARVAGVDKRGRYEAALVEVLERAHLTVVGRFYSEHNIAYVVPDQKNLHQDILIPQEGRHDAKPGQIVVAKIVEYPSFRNQAIGEIVEVLGDHMAPGMEIDIAIRSYQLPDQWPEAVVEELSAFSEIVHTEEMKGRKDLRAKLFVTIDGDDAKDFDDAVYAERKKHGWRLWVAIADVSHYVKTDSHLDLEAYVRGNSAYFPERVIPMLPEMLSNGLCSLRPKVDRLAMTCEIDLDDQGDVQRYRFYESVIHSHARLTYDQVAGMLYENHVECRRKYNALLPALETLDGIYRVLQKARKKRGAIEFESTESKIIFGEDKKIERIMPTIRNDAHKIIEECMITANVCAARFLEKSKVPAVYRIHENPDDDRISDVRHFLGPFGLHLKGGKEPKAIHFAELMSSIKDRVDARLIQTVLLRSMQQAVYSSENVGHFGLSLDAYTHFTSPIRRYPDLIVHRAIKHVLSRQAPEKFRYTTEQMVQTAEHCSMTERRADQASWDVIAWLKCEYMLDKIGDSFSGIISSVTSFGLFVELDGIYVEGLVHITSLGEEYFHYDPIRHHLRGERSNKLFRLGDPIQVTLVQVSLDERKIDFELTSKKR